MDISVYKSTIIGNSASVSDYVEEKNTLHGVFLLFTVCTAERFQHVVEHYAICQNFLFICVPRASLLIVKTSL